MSVATAIDTDDIAREMAELGRRARAAVHELAQADTGRKNKALKTAAAALRERTDDLLAANARDMAAAEARNIAPSLLDRLKLDAGRIEAMAAGLEQIAALPDPVGGLLLGSAGCPGSIHCTKRVARRDAWRLVSRVSSPRSPLQIANWRPDGASAHRHRGGGKQEAAAAVPVS